MANKVYLDNESGLIEAIFSGDQDEVSIKDTYGKIHELLQRNNTPPGQARIIFNVSDYKKVTPRGRRVALQELRRLPVGRMAITGPNLVVKNITRFGLRATGMGNKIRFFDKQSDGLEWLNAKDPDAQPDSAASTPSVSSEVERLRGLDDIFARAINGDYSKDVDIPLEDDEVSHYIVGVQVMLDSIRDKIDEYEELRRSLEEQVGVRTQDITKQNELLATITVAATALIRAHRWRDEISEILANIGKTAEVSRVYIFERTDTEQSKKYFEQTFEWAAKGIEPQTHNPDLKHISLKDAGFSRWEKIFSRAELVLGHVKDFPETEREFLQKQAIKSIVIIPFNVDDDLWGFIGFDECNSERNWKDSEISVLRLITSLIGSSIERERAEEALRTRTEELERVNQFMVNREDKMIELKAEIERLQERLGASADAAD